MTGASQLFIHWAGKCGNPKVMGFLQLANYSLLVIAAGSPKFRKSLRMSQGSTERGQQLVGDVRHGCQSGTSCALFSTCPRINCLTPLDSVIWHKCISLVKPLLIDFSYTLLKASYIIQSHIYQVQRFNRNFLYS